MIPATGYEIAYKIKREDGSHRWASQPVIAFDLDGTPQVAGPRGLVHPSEAVPHLDPNTERLVDWMVEHTGHHHLIPGGGWMVKITPKYDHPAWVEPVVAWRITPEGFGEVLLSGGDGTVDSFSYLESNHRFEVWHPDHHPAP